jgi:phosphocarrier protein HPr
LAKIDKEKAAVLHGKNLTMFYFHVINGAYSTKGILPVKEFDFMKQRRIMLTTVEEAKDFVTSAMKCDFDIDVFYNRVVIDAKSLLGVMSLDLTKVLTVEYDGENKGFEAFLDTVAVKATAA